MEEEITRQVLFFISARSAVPPSEILHFYYTIRKRFLKIFFEIFMQAYLHFYIKTALLLNLFYTAAIPCTVLTSLLFTATLTVAAVFGQQFLFYRS